MAACPNDINNTIESNFLKVLGALLAGGKSERFGSDKAMAVYQGQYLIDHAIGLLEPQCDALLICGRSYGDYAFVKDDPEDQGPLGGINAALRYAKNQGFDAVISFPCDTIRRDMIKRDMIRRDNAEHDADGRDRAIEKSEILWFEHGKAAYVRNQPVIGYWPSTLSDRLGHWLHSQKRRSMMAWAEYIEASAIEAEDIFVNINRPEDLPNDLLNG